MPREPEKYGYVRVSSKDQNEERQIIALHEAGVLDANIFIDKQSGKDFQRPAYRRLVRKMRRNDILCIKSIDRMGRNYEEIQQEWRDLTKRKGIDIVVLDMPLLDTRRGKDLVGSFLSDIVLQILSFVAENERINIRQRQREGIDAAMARGVKFGRAPLEKPERYQEIKNLYLAGFYSARSASKIMGVTHKTFLKWVEADNPEDLAARKEIYGNMHICDEYLYEQNNFH